MVRNIERVLVVEDNQPLLRTLTAALGKRYAEVRGCRAVGEIPVGWQPDLVVLDVMLPDGTALDVLSVLQRGGPAPLVVAMSGRAERVDTFELGRRGVGAFLEKPIQLQALEQAILRAQEPPDLTPVLRQSVGAKGLGAVETEVRKVMIDEALARSQGSRRGAARLLAMSRQLLQYFLRR